MKKKQKFEIINESINDGNKSIDIENIKVIGFEIDPRTKIVVKVKTD